MYVVRPHTPPSVSPRRLRIWSSIAFPTPSSKVRVEWTPVRHFTYQSPPSEPVDSRCAHCPHTHALVLRSTSIC
ncbi:hypothetical protein BDN70DRAFT_355302 [Pholiota conissans]|uniref:Uncharacterized protein n=1 Tax=Pholiota conissans TaxID=109636 RepID=A0A9P5YQW4_9AGAR|nr:hypothetical protein BDN70DRAFT_355302 [Pholiota conissans]